MGEGGSQGRKLPSQHRWEGKWRARATQKAASSGEPVLAALPEKGGKKNLSYSISARRAEHQDEAEPRCCTQQCIRWDKVVPRGNQREAAAKQTWFGGFSNLSSLW